MTILLEDYSIYSKNDSATMFNISNKLTGPRIASKELSFRPQILNLEQIRLFYWKIILSIVKMIELPPCLIFLLNSPRTLK